MLTDRAVKAATARGKTYKIADRQGLFLHVSPKAHKTWRCKRRFDRKKQALGLGIYPDVSLAAAREARDDAHKILRCQIDEPVLLAVLRKVEARGAIETARRLKPRVGSVFVYASGLGIKAENPSVAVGAAFKPVPPAKRYPALIKAKEVRQLVHDVDRAGASPVTTTSAHLDPPPQWLARYWKKIKRRDAAGAKCDSNRG